MNIVFIVDNGKTIGGGDYAQFKFAEYLARKGHNVTVFAANKNEFFSEIQTKNLQIRVRNELPRVVKGFGLLNEIWDKLYTKTKVEPFVEQEKPDYIIGYLRKSAIKTVKLGKKYDIKTINFIFENPIWMKKKLGKRFLREYKGRFKRSWDKTKKAYQETDILIPNSELTRKECSEWLDRDIAEPVYPGIDFISENNTKEQDQIIYVGRLNEYKNVDEIIKALDKVKKAPKLVLVGSGGEEKTLRKLAKKLGVDVEFKGRLTDKEKWKEIRKAMFMIFPSSFEGFGMPPAEALACEKPCICSDIPILKEVYGDKVEYFPEHDVKKLAEKIEYLIKNLKYRKKRGKAGKKFVTKKYTWEKSAKKIEKILK